MSSPSVLSEKKQVLDELQRVYEGDAWHGENLSDILSGISAEKALAKPIPAAHSIWEITLHIAAWNETFTERLRGGVRPEPLDGDFPQITETSEKAWRAALQRLKTSQQSLPEAIRNLADEAFPKRFADRDFTLSFFLRGIVRHIVYHSGQIGLLKKASSPTRT